MPYRPLQIGGLTFDPPLALAPMAGYSDYPLRRIVRELGGAGLYYTELISCHSVIHAHDKIRSLIMTDRGEYPLAVQLFGSDPAYMAAAASVLEGLGAGLIDINMGCPVSKVVKTGGGAVLMRDPATAAAVTAAVRKAVSVPVTVKIRLGWDSASINAPEFAVRMAGAGAQAVAVHGRTRAQGYSGEADWGGVAAVVEAVRRENPLVPVIGNGDVTSPERARELLERTDCDGIMIGRAALGAPWLFRQTDRYLRTGELPPPPDYPERGRLALRHLEYLTATYGEKLAALHIRRIACGYARGREGAAEFRRRIVMTPDTQTAAEIISEFFNQQENSLA